MNKDLYPHHHETHAESAIGGIAPEEREVLLDLPALVSILRKGAKTILASGIVMLLLATIVVFLLPPQYTASAAFIPPGSNVSGASVLAGQLSQLSGLGGGLLGSVKSSGDLYVGILKSRSVADELVKSFKLQTVYDVRKQSQAVKLLANHSSFVLGIKDPIVTISVADRSPERARDMANSYLDALQATSGGLALTESSQRRSFFEQRLAQEKNALADAEVALKKSQERTGLIAPAGQTSAEIGAAAQLRSQIATRQVRLAALLHDETEQNPDVLRLRNEIGSLQSQVGQMQNGKTGGPSDSLSNAQVPALELEYVRLARDVKYHEALFEIIARQYEAARLDEAHDAPLQVLDRATIPDAKSWPPKLPIVLGAFFLGMLGSAIFLVLRPQLDHLLRETKTDHALRKQ